MSLLRHVTGVVFNVAGIAVFFIAVSFLMDRDWPGASAWLLLDISLALAHLRLKA